VNVTLAYYHQLAKDMHRAIVLKKIIYCRKRRMAVEL